MAKQIYFEDVEVGTGSPALEKNPTTQQLVRYAGASGDFYQIHYDKDFALGNNLPGVILHGALKNAFLGQLMTDFAGELGWLRKLGVQYRGMDQPGTKVCRTRQGLKEIRRRRLQPGRLRNLARKRQGREDHARHRHRHPALARRGALSERRGSTHDADRGANFPHVARSRRRSTRLRRVDPHYTKSLIRLLAAHAIAEKLTALGYQRALETLDQSNRFVR